MTSVFSKIINGELPGRFVYRDEDVVAFLTIEPLSYGHTLVVPVQEVDKWTDLEPEVWAKLTAVAQRVGQAIVSTFDAPRAGFVIAGFDVPHTHIHVFPATDMGDYDFRTALKMNETDPKLMDEAALKISLALSAQN
ncbi:HIT family protein [Corynebacterium sp. ES2794-CONJ1]|uniref:HIT family protein n=1 Tax=unclassified Corynebacterium TaxID=2624378 RepID=UPI002168CFF0|nr:MULTISPECIES: HIT family protein [unclassified Corynebacterium]MCS4490288.1 HIT family protein [Corynebacterium sp. ES2775-CONJ]MCS4491901.1 HIT family protein [Corynebacterium sp. ES2715-CONJ3]MCS4532006.1 HIT family protein [Corynebacterium sp. ES2730-CONJ]MCU9519407.1 HIT family protein [Corynebacterium sp. ES2794-CONJ1]